MRPLAEQTVLVTGATDGLGRALALELARTGCTVLIHGRDEDRGRVTLDEVVRRSGNHRVHWYRADLADLAAVADLAAEVQDAHPQLDALVNNAGIGADVPGGGRRQVSVDGLELRFAVNYLAGYSLTRRLLPALHAAARAHGSARIVMVASAGQAPIDFDDVMLERRYRGIQAYCQSKLAQIMFAFDLADELVIRDISANALHPATYMPTKIVPSPMSSLAEGVEATARLVTDPILEHVTGRYFDGLHEARADEQAYDPDARRQLRKLSERLTGVVTATR